MRKHKTWICGILFVIGLLQGMTPLAANAAELPVSYENRAAIETEIHELIAQNRDTTPSVSVIVFDNTQDICSVIYGDADTENGIEADESTVYEWGSVSKLLVWTSAMQLYEQGKLDFNADIRTYLPDGFLAEQSFEEPITMLHLMNHNTGFQSPYREPETPQLDELMPLDRALTEIAPAQIYAPGEVVAYSNWGAALAGYVVECISGMDYAEYVQTHIFQPLGMTHTALRPDLSDNAWVAAQRQRIHCYTQEDGGLAAMGECRRYIHVYPAGSACGTISDMALFARAFLSVECPLFENADTLDIMLSPSLYYADGTTPRSCHGFRTELCGKLLLGHGGNTEGFSSLLELDRESGTGFVMMTNKRGDRFYKEKLPALLYGTPDYAAMRSENFTELDLSGHYIVSGGMFETGCLKVCGLFNDRFHIKAQDGGFTGSNGVVSMTQISENTAVVRLVTGAEYLYYIRTDENGSIVGLENSSVDFIKIGNVQYFGSRGILLLMMAGLVFMAIMLPIHGIRLKKHKGQDIFALKVKETIAGMFAIAVAVDICLIIRLGTAGEAVRAGLCILLVMLSAGLAAANLLCWGTRNKSAGRGILLIETLCSLCIIVGIVYWRMYQFWGF